MSGRLIAALAYPGVQLLDILGPLEAFNLASQQLIDDGQRRKPEWRLEIIARQTGLVRGMSGLAVHAGRSLADGVDDIDTLLIPGALTGETAFYTDPQYIAWLQQAAHRVRRICSVCSGAFLLASAGLLDQRKATTHWMDAAELQRQFPRVKVEANQIYLEDQGIYTSGGITAGIDLALALIEQDHSRRLALQTAKRLLVFLKRPGDQLQFNSFLAAQAQPGQFERLLDWLPDNLHEVLDVATLAERCYMSERSFRRRFEQHMGISPHGFLAQARVHKAQGLLETTDLSLADIARRCGFRSAGAMRYAFARQLDVTPSVYRQRFGKRAI